MSNIVKKIEELKKSRNAIILAHTYQPGEVQDVADFVGDSYGLSVKASEVVDADIIIFAGVRFMAETAKILSPNKIVILPNQDAGCPMADMITVDELTSFKNDYPDYKVICYVNTTVEIKAMCDICCTSSNALKIVKKIPIEDGILFIPDKHLGSWINEESGRKKMIMWDGFCPTHAKISPTKLAKLRSNHPEAPILIHPEAPKICRDMADAVLSTAQMCTYVNDSKSTSFIIATEEGIIHTLKKHNPEKTYYHVGKEIICPNMKLGSLNSIYAALDGSGGEIIEIDSNIAAKAIGSLRKMLDMSI